MYDDTWAKMMKVVVPGIRNIKVGNVAFIFPVLFSIYQTLQLCP